MPSGHSGVKRHIIYIPGLGDHYDGVRRVCLYLWRRPGVTVSLVPMRWSDATETYASKQARIAREIKRLPDHAVTIVGESAGGAVTLDTLHRHGGSVMRAVTVCGMNQGAANVSPTLYRKNPAFEHAMNAADIAASKLDETERTKLLTLYSSADFTVRPKNTLLPGVEARDLKIPGHMFAIFGVLLWYYRLILKQ